MAHPGTVCIFGDDPTGFTGFGQVVDRLVAAVSAAGGRPVVVALKRRGRQQYHRAEVVNAMDRADPDGWRTLEAVLADTRAATLISVADPWALKGVAEIRQRRRFEWIGYTPVDTTPYPRYIQLVRQPPQYMDVAALMIHMDRGVTFAEFGRRAVAEMLAAVPATDDAGPPPLSCIPLGVDPARFSPSDRSTARAVFEGAVGADDLLFTCIKVNSMRSGFDTLIAAWARYLALAAAVDPGLARRSRLYLHTHPTEGAHLLPVLLARHGVAESVLLSTGLQNGETVSEEVMVGIHRATDVALSCARGEGFGLPILEALSCAVPAVVPDYGAPAEYGGEAVWRVPIAATYHLEFAATDFAVVDGERMAAGMLALARDAALRQRMGQAGRTIARQMDWQHFVQRWAALLTGNR